MSDGNTAIQIGPVLTEGEMKSFQDLFTKIANTITQASGLAKEFELLKGQVAGLTNDLEYQRSRNSTLDEAMTHIRTERDEANRLLAEGRAEWEASKRDLAKLQDNLSEASHRIESLTSELTQTRKDRDDAAFHNLELTEELNSVKAALAKVHEALGINPAPTPNPTQAHPSPTTGPLTTETGTSQPEQTQPVFVGEGHGFRPEDVAKGSHYADDPRQEEAKPVERRKVYRGDPDWSHDKWIDAQTGSYGFSHDLNNPNGQDWYYAS